MRYLLGVFALLALAACAPAIPDSAAHLPAPAEVQTEALADTQMQPAAASPSGAPATTPATTTDAPADAVISDEQDFTAVAERETIESDAARIAANRERYEIVEPTDLPARPENSMSLVVEFALATTNPKGQPLYRRSKLFAERRFERACGKYSSSDMAQEAFLLRGGPKRDPMGMDPDGDGFACYWDPTPFRQARAAAAPASAPASQ